MQKNVLFTFLALGLTQSAFTCGPGVDPPNVRCEDGAAPTMAVVEVGTETNDVFSVATADQLFPLEYGSQGGQHTFVAFRFHGGDDKEWGHQVVLRDDLGEEVGNRYIQESACRGKWTVLSNVQVFVYDPTVAQVNLHVESGPVDPNTGVIQVKASGDSVLRLR